MSCLRAVIGTTASRLRPPIFLFVVIAIAVAVFALELSPAIALTIGALIGLTCGNPERKRTSSFAKHALTASVIGLGGGVRLAVVLEIGRSSFVYTAIGIVASLLVGVGLAKLIQVPGKSGFLVSAGTAICGGSAIAAVAPAIDASEEETSVALATVFILNGVALFIFPAIGHALNLAPEKFALWAALAIHDTSSVVGAAIAYDPASVAFATTVKLARALWIVPVALLASFLYRRESKSITPPIPVAVIGFLMLAALLALIPGLESAGNVIAGIAHRLMASTLFAIGLSFTRPTLTKVGPRALAHGVILWLLVAATSLAVIA
ncbi:MAG: putative sulfate exporter family transporter [Clostridia bacterium]|nr:putative sulfate exporter family transporter [Deltaproteobacteria bacterium]